MTDGRASRVSLLALLACLGLSLGTACTIDSLAEIWLDSGDEASTGPWVVDHFPSQGDQGIGRRVRPLVAMSRALAPDELEGLGEAFAIETEGHSFTTGKLVPGLGPGVIRVDLGDLAADSSYRLTVPLPAKETDLALSTAFDTALPRGLAFNTSTDLEVVAFGANPDHAALMQTFFVPGLWPLWVLLVDDWPASSIEGDPPPAQLRFAPARLDLDKDNPYILHREYGFISTIRDVEIAANGRIDHEQSSLFLPIWTGADVLVLHLDDLHVVGSLQIVGGVPQFDSLEFHGSVTASWLLSLAAFGGGWELAVDLLELDLDRNEDGVPEAASFVLRSVPSRIARSEIDF